MNIISQKYRSKLKIVLKFALFAFCIFNSHAAQATVRYPIRELDSCRDAKECYFYCQIPENQPACWSYNRYVINSRILGETTTSPEEMAKKHGITFPVAELGNCNSPTECFSFCDKPENQTTCLSFAQKKGLNQENKPAGAPSLKAVQAAQKELGCDSETSCMAFCNKPENMEKCHTFAQKYNLEKKTSSSGNNIASSQIVKKAKTELGCGTETACKVFCSQETNVTRCQQFAQKYGLAKEENKEETNKRKQMVETAKKEFGCTSAEGCALFCSQPENIEKCASFAQKYNSSAKQSPASQASLQKPNEATSANSTGCRTEKECKEFCEKNPGKCPGFTPTSTKENKIKPSPQLQPASTDSTFGPVLTPPQDYIFQPQQNPPVTTPSQNIQPNQPATPIPVE